MSIFSLRQWPPRKLLGGTLAIGAAVLILAHPALYPRPTAHFLIVATVVLGGAVSRLCQASFWTAWKPPRSLLWPAVLLGSSAVVSVLVNPGASWSALFPLAANLLFLWLGWWLATDRQALQWMGGSILAGGALAGLYAALQAWNLDPLPPATLFTDRITSVFTNPNHLGNYLACLLPLALAGFFRNQESRFPWAGYLLISLLYTGLLLSASRGAWCSALGGGGIVLGGYVRQVRRSYLPWQPLSWALLGGLLVGISLLCSQRPALQGPQGPVSLRQRLLSSRNILGPGVGQDPTINHRYFLWQVAWKMICTHPFSGVGYGCFQHHFPAARESLREQPRFQTLHPGQRQEITPFAHNEYLHLWAETGVFSLLGFLGLILGGLGGGIRQIRNHPREDLYLWGIAGSIVTMLLDSLVSYPLRLPLNSALFWVLLGSLFQRNPYPFQADDGLPRPEDRHCLLG